MIRRDYWPTVEWRFSEPKSMNMDSIKLTAIDKELKYRYQSINGIVIVRGGNIVFERYNNGFGPEDTHNVASVAKSITSALIGILIDRGYIKNVDQKILDFFPEYKASPSDIQKRTLTIKNLLTMTAPVAWQTGTGGFEPLNRLRRQKDWIKFILDLLGKKGDTGKFQYSSVGSHLLSAIISRTTGKCARVFGNENLFKTLGMREIPDSNMKSFTLDDVFGKNVNGWINDPTGITIGGWGMTITPRDMARFGFLYLNRGQWSGKQIIPEKWIEESIAENRNDYGYNWWLKGSGENFSYFAAGSGGSFIWCIPGKDLVISIASKITMRPRDRTDLIDNYILPSIIK